MPSPSQAPFSRTFSFERDDDSRPYFSDSAPYDHVPPPPPVHRTIPAQQSYGLTPQAHEYPSIPPVSPTTHRSQSSSSPGMDNNHANCQPPYGFVPPATHIMGHGPSDSNVSREGLASGGALPDNMSHGSFPTPDSHSLSHDGIYADDPYRSRSNPFQNIDPNEIDDDDDDDIAAYQRGNRASAAKKGLAAGGAAAGAGAAAAAAALSNRDPDGHGNYAPMGPNGPGEYNHGFASEKAEWTAKEKAVKRKRKIIIGLVVAFIVAAIIAGAVAGGIIGAERGGKDTSAPASSHKDDDSRGEYDKDSPQVQRLLNDPDLHRVFPGMDYTPFNAQYPDCMHNPPSQNNITLDVAVLTQLTSAIRLYGTDCNQTDMVLAALDLLDIKDVKVWLGAWLGNNQTTNDRQMAQMWSILDKHGASPFAGVIVGNEVLYRKDMSDTALGKILKETKDNITTHGWNLPLATSDLGDNWTEQLASEVDIVMANIHPFFAGVEAHQAASWTWSFWQNHDVAVTKSLTDKKHVISETGWPSAGGNDCGTEAGCTSDTQGSVAGIDEMNIFLGDWVCQALKNQTEYFWFETFDEPWKIRYNTKDEQWEDKWGLMTIDRKLKPGVKIPDCGGQKAKVVTGNPAAA
ncbi:glycoside hydrolase family 17 protein [Phyllosticta citrichinensis]|uniref:glucan endo-1,3-beta-D-glucosidase n=1 Tax=Phyllosticta citrichinensis TaxID=1130410 RepID=A0ABR1Y5J5_9PEZI